MPPKKTKKGKGEDFPDSDEAASNTSSSVPVGKGNKNKKANKPKNNEDSADDEPVMDKGKKFLFDFLEKAGIIILMYKIGFIFYRNYK